MDPLRLAQLVTAGIWIFLPALVVGALVIGALLLIAKRLNSKAFTVIAKVMSGIVVCLIGYLGFALYINQ
jgi:hypothetical protein